MRGGLKMDLSNHYQKLDLIRSNSDSIINNLWSDTCGCLVQSQLMCLSQNFIEQGVLSFVVNNEKTRQKKRRELTHGGIMWRDSIENASLVDPVPEVDEEGPQAWLLTKLDRYDIIGDMFATARLLGSPDYNCKEKWDTLVQSGDACYCIIYDILRSHNREYLSYDDYENELKYELQS